VIPNLPIITECLWTKKKLLNEMLCVYYEKIFGLWPLRKNSQRQANGGNLKKKPKWSFTGREIAANGN
jgi:hypothetical protein